MHFLYYSLSERLLCAKLASISGIQITISVFPTFVSFLQLLWNGPLLQILPQTQALRRHPCAALQHALFPRARPKHGRRVRVGRLRQPPPQKPQRRQRRLPGSRRRRRVLLLPPRRVQDAPEQAQGLREAGAEEWGAPGAHDQFRGDGPVRSSEEPGGFVAEVRAGGREGVHRDGPRYSHWQRVLPVFFRPSSSEETDYGSW